MGEKARGGRKHQASLFDLRSSVGRISSGQGQKFFASTRGTLVYLEREITPGSNEGNSGNRSCRVEEASYPFIYALRCRDSFYSSFNFHIFVDF